MSALPAKLPPCPAMLGGKRSTRGEERRWKKRRTTESLPLRQLHQSAGGLSVHPAVNSENPETPWQNFHHLKEKEQALGAGAGSEERGMLATGGQGWSLRQQPWPRARSNPPCGSARGSARGTVAERHAPEASRAEGGQGTQAKDLQPCLMTLSSIWKTREAESLAPNAVGSKIKSLNRPISIPDESHRSCNWLKHKLTQTPSLQNMKYSGGLTTRQLSKPREDVTSLQEPNIFLKSHPLTKFLPHRPSFSTTK